MKKNERSIYIVLIIILVGIIIGGVTYILMSNKEDNNINENNNTNNEVEQITLSESELEEYLSYVPTTVAYNTKSINVSDVKEEDLIAYAASQLHYDYAKVAGDESEIPVTELRSFFNQKYNRNITIKDTKELSEGMYNYDYALCFYYTNGSSYLSGNICGSGSDYLTITDKYEISNKNDLIIYEQRVSYSLLFDGIGNYYALIDNYTFKETNLENICPSDKYDYDSECIKDYFIQNKRNFTKYKHTYKKNDSGYYWYSTEVVES